MNNITKTILVILSLIVIIFFCLKGLGDALTPLIISFTFAYLFFPLIRSLEQKGINRNFSVVFISIIFTFVLSLTFYLVVPKLYSDSKAFIKELPQNSTRLLAKAELAAEKMDIDVDLSKDHLKEMVEDNISTISASILKSITKGFKGFFSSIVGLVLGILNIFLIPLFFFYVVNDYEKITKNISELIPNQFKPKLKKYLKLTNKVLSGFIRGQLLVALFLGTMYAIGLSIIGLRFGILIGLLSGFMCLIPYVGAIVGFATAIIFGLATDLELTRLFYVCILYGFAQVLEGNVITPKFVGNKVGLSAFTSVLALIIGGNLFGLVGMIIAIPMAAIVKTIFNELKQEYLEMEL